MFSMWFQVSFQPCGFSAPQSCENLAAASVHIFMQTTGQMMMSNNKVLLKLMKPQETICYFFKPQLLVSFNFLFDLNEYTNF